MNPRIMQLIADVWVNRVTSYPLYVVRLVRTHIYAGFFVSIAISHINFFFFHVNLFYIPLILYPVFMILSLLMQYFGSHYSALLPRSQDVSLYYADDDDNVFPALLTRSYFGGQIARIIGGWFDFVHMNGLMVREVYVVVLSEVAGTLRIRFFPADD